MHNWQIYHGVEPQVELRTPTWDADYANDLMASACLQFNTGFWNQSPAFGFTSGNSRLT